MNQTNYTTSPLRSLPVAILLTGFVAGTLDGLAALAHFMIAGGKDPGVIFKYIASGVFGREAFTGGTVMIFWGILFHYLIAYGLTIAFFLLYPRVGWIRENIVAAGILYGILAWIITTRLIIPYLSKIRQPPLNWEKAIIPILILVFFIGLPIALMTKKHYLYKK